MKPIFKYARPFRKQLILGPIFKLIEAICELCLPIFMARLIDDGITKHNQAAIISNAQTMILLTLVGLASVLVCQYYASVASQGYGTALRHAVFKKIGQFTHADLDQYGTDTLMTRLTSDINQLQNALAMLIRLVIRAPFLSIGSIIMSALINWKMALIFAAILPIFALLVSLIMLKTVPLFKRVQEKIDALNQSLSEQLSGVRVIRAFNRQDASGKAINEASDSLAKSYRRVANLSALLNPATTLLLNVGMILIVVFGAHQVELGSMSQGDVLALINYLTQMLLALIVVANLVVIFTRAKSSGNRVGEILATKDHAALPLPKDPITPDFKAAEYLHFNQVAFQYPGADNQTLTNINFSVNKGDWIGITGQTGSGKSTLLQLIPRFYDPTIGAVKLFETPATQLDLVTLRKGIGYVPQQSALFSGTIGSNLRFSAPDATEEEMWAALKVAQCMEFMRGLPDGLDTIVEAGGGNFSGGQRQRLAIARAIVRHPKLLILDDSLSALDYQTDLDLRQALHQHLTASTVIIVSQRISSINDATNILVLEQGQQMGFASHETLLKTVPIYQEIVDSQSKGGLA